MRLRLMETSSRDIGLLFSRILSLAEITHIWILYFGYFGIMGFSLFLAFV
jgi:hypothetical protein